jgi:hypothetical protein
MNDKIAAAILARLLAKGLLEGIWVPPLEGREMRILITQRTKMTRQATRAKNRLHPVQQRHHLAPADGDPLILLWSLLKKSLYKNNILRARNTTDMKID